MNERAHGEAPVEVALFSYRYLAEMALGILEDEGIPGVVVADDAGGAYPGMGGVRLLVPHEHAGRARELLAELEAENVEAENE